MDLGLNNKVAVVTGSSKGIGKAIATALAEEGCTIVICSRNINSLNSAADEIRKKTKSEVFVIEADLTKKDQISHLFQTVKNQFDTIDILVNNTGGPPALFFNETNLNDWKNAVNQLLYSMILCCDEVIPVMKKQKWGRIINMTSIAAKQPIEKLILSNTIRSGILGFTKTLANEIACHSICVNAVCPGYTLTKRVEELAESLSSDDTSRNIMAEWKKQIPLGRLANPKEIANLVVFLSSEKSSYITGNTIQVDGGFYKSIL